MIPVNGAIPEGFSWFCEPSKHRVEGDKIIIVPDSGSDFWQRTHYGFRNNNGHLGSVVTNLGYSDWATQPFTKKEVDMEFMIKHVKQDFEIYCREYGTERWQQLRISRLELPLDTVFHVGIYACSPKQGGFEAIFDNIEIDAYCVCWKQPFRCSAAYILCTLSRNPFLLC